MLWYFFEKRSARASGLPISNFVHSDPERHDKIWTQNGPAFEIFKILTLPGQPSLGRVPARRTEGPPVSVERKVHGIEEHCRTRRQPVRGSTKFRSYLKKNSFVYNFLFLISSIPEAVYPWHLPLSLDFARLFNQHTNGSKGLVTNAQKSRSTIVEGQSSLLRSW